MKDFRNWFGVRSKRQKAVDELYRVFPRYLSKRAGEDKINVSHCLLIVSSPVRRDIIDTVIICIQKEDNEDIVKLGYDTYDLFKKEKKYIVNLYNYQTNKMNKYSPQTKYAGEIEKIDIEIPQVDYDSLIKAIKDLQDNMTIPFLKNGRLERFYFAVIYKMLIDGAFGTKNNKTSQRDFCDYMKRNGLDAGEHSILQEHFNKLEGDFPEITAKQNDSARFSPQKNDDIKVLIKTILEGYIEKSHKYNPLEQVSQQ